VTRLGGKPLGILAGHALGHRRGDELGLVRGPLSCIGGFDGSVMRLDRGLLGGSLDLFRGDLGRVFSGFCGELGFRLRDLGHLRRFFGQAGSLEGCGLRGAVGRGLRTGGRIRGGGGGIVTGSGRLVAGLGDPVGPCQRFMGYFRDAEKHGILKNFARRALGHADLGGSAADHIVEIAAIHDAAGNIHTGIVERARGTANGARQHL